MATDEVARNLDGTSYLAKENIASVISWNMKEIMPRPGLLLVRRLMWQHSVGR